MARCPAHEDRVSSLSVGEGEEGRVLVRCFAGCTVEMIANALGLELADLFSENGSEPGAASPPRLAVTEKDVAHWHDALMGSEKLLARLDELRGWTPQALVELELGFDGERVTFPYRDSDHRLVGLGRYHPNPKRRADGPKLKADAGSRRQLFPAPERVAGDLWLVEGEPDAVRLNSIGLPTVGVPGVKGWRPEWAERFRERRLVVCFDCDRAGREAAGGVVADLARTAAGVRLLDLDPAREDGFDVSDFLARAKTEAERTEARGLILDVAHRTPVVGSPPAPPQNGAIAIPASSVRRERVAWLLPGLVPKRGVTLFAGNPGIGKSQWTCFVAGQVSRGELTEEPAVTLMVTAEDSLTATVRPRLEAVGADLDRVRFVQMKREGVDEGLTLPDDVGELDRLVAETGARLVVIDPLTAHLTGSVDSWRDQSVRRALAPLQLLAEKHTCGVVAVAHLNKASSSDPLLRIGGSIGFQGAARSILLFGRDPDDEAGEKGRRRVLVHYKCNVAAEAPSQLYEVESILIPASGEQPEVETARLKYLGECEHDSSRLLDSQTEDERSATEEACEWLSEFLTDEEHPSREIKAAAKREGFSAKVVRRARERLGVVTEDRGFPARSYWRLPSGALGEGHDCETEQEGHDWQNPHGEADSGSSEPGSAHSDALSQIEGTTEDWDALFEENS